MAVYFIGQPEKKIFYPCVALHLGDGPAQKEVCGIMKGNCNYGCTLCEHNTLSNELYGPTTRNRNFETIKRLCKESGNLMFKQNRVLLPQEKVAKEQLQQKSVYPYYNSFFDAPMGIKSNIFTCTPPDILHTICAGIMKNLLLWVLCIISKFSENDKFAENKSLVDSRLGSIFRLPNNIPHVYWDFFPDGIFKFMPSKQDKKSKERTTGSFSGFKSSAYIGILLQLHFVIGWNGNILPNKSNYMHNQTNLGNINNKIQLAILSTLDVYFQLKMHPISQINIDALQTTIKSMQAHVLSVWFIKQCIIGSTRIHHKSINMHKIIHMHLYTYYGSYLKLDTASYESSHKLLTKGIYNKTSRQTNIFHKEMLTKYIEHDIHQQYSFIGNALTLSLEDHFKLFNFPIMIENITFTLISNLPYYQLKFSDNYKQIILTNNNHKLIDDPSSILIHSSLTLANMLLVLDKIFPNKARKEFINELNNNTINVTIRSGVTYNANVESGMGSGHLYATSKCGKSKLRPRYDYILVNASEINTGNSYVQPAQLLEILEVTQTINNDLCTEVHYVIQYMNESVRNISQVKGSPFKLYTWEYMEGGNITTNPIFNIDVITQDNINGQAYIFPFFDGHNCPRNHYTTTDDLFWLIDRKYFDRSGWENYTENFINATGILLNNREIKEFEKTIPNTDFSSTSRKRKQNVLVDEDENDNDEDTDDDSNK